MAKGDAGASAQPTQTTTYKPSPHAEKLLKLGMPYATDFAKGGGPQLPGFSLIQGFDPLQTQGQNMVLGNTGAQQDIVGAAGTGNQFLSSGAALDPNSNPALKATIDASVRPIYSNLTEQILPKIRSNAVVSGNWGGSRQGIAEGLAIDRASQAAGDTAAKVATAGYNSGLDAMGKAQGQAGTVAQAQTIPGISTSGVGDVRQALAQAMLGEQGQRFSYNETLPLLMAKELIGLSSGIPGGTSISTASNPTPAPSGMQMAGLGLAGLGSAGSFMTGLSNLMPFLAMSDPAMKYDVVQIGTLDNGIPLFTFRYKDDPFRTLHFGFMADKVPPRFVEERNGVKFVKYKALIEWTRDRVKEAA